MNLENVLLAIDALEQVPPRKFDIQTWGDFKHEHPDGAKLTLRDACGTAGCGLGWIASDKRANAKGLWLMQRAISGELPNLLEVVPVYRGRLRQYAGAAFLGVGVSVADILFMPDEYDYTEDKSRNGYVRPQNVVDRLQLLAHVGEPRFLEMFDGAGQRNAWENG